MFKPFVKVGEDSAIARAEKDSKTAHALAQLASPTRMNAPRFPSQPPTSPSAKMITSMNAEVWVRDGDKGWVPGRIEKQFDRAAVRVRTSTHQLIEVDLSKGEQLPTVNPSLEKVPC